MSDALLAAQDLQDPYVRDACGVRDLSEGVSGFAGREDGISAFLRDGSAPNVGALHAGERQHLAGRGGDGLLERGDGAGRARVVKRDGDAEVAGLVAERGVFTLLAEGVCVSGHSGNLRYRCGFVKGGA